MADIEESEPHRSVFEPVASTLARHARSVPDRLFVHAQGRGMTYAELDGHAWAIAHGLTSRGSAPGDRVGYLSDYRVEVISCFFGVSRAGGVNVPLNIYLRGEFLTHQLIDSGSNTVVVDDAGWQNLLPVIDKLENLRRVVILDVLPDLITEVLPPGVELLTYDDLLSRSSSAFEVERRPGDPFGFVYTSGTTGMPKACVLSEAYVWRTASAHTDAWATRDADVLFTATPMYHISGYLGLVTALHNRGSLVNDTPYSASRYMERAAEVGATIAYGVAFHALAALRQPPRPTDRDHRIRLGFFGPLAAELREQFEDRFGFELLSEFYAQSECSLVAYRRLGGGVRETGRCGTAAPDVELAVVDDDDNPVAPGTVGEIVVRPRRPGALFSGYWAHGDATATSWRNLWHHTGDMGRLDVNGVLSFVDRKVDSIRRRGEMVSAFEVERAISLHPKITEVAVHGVTLPSEVDQLVKACIVVEDGQSITPKDIAEFFAEALPYYAAPRFVEVVASLPKNASGRVMKYALRDQPSSERVWDLEAMDLQPKRSERRSHRTI